MFLRLTGGESSVGVGGYRCLLLFVTRLCRSLITMSAISLGRVLACHPILSSAAKTTWRQFVTLVCHTCANVRKMRARLPGMPFPLMVLAMIAVGWWRGWLRALQSSSTLCPSTMMACQLHTWGHDFGSYILYTNKPFFTLLPHIFYLPKSFTAFLIFLHMMLQRGGVTLPQTVDVHDGHQVVKLVIRGKRHGLPDRTLRHFTIPHQAVDTVTEEGNRARLGRGARQPNRI